MDRAKRNRGNRNRGKQRERDAIPIVEHLTREPAKRTGRDQNGEEGDVQTPSSVWEVKSHQRQPQGYIGGAEEQLQKAARNTGLEAGGVLHRRLRRQRRAQLVARGRVGRRWGPST